MPERSPHRASVITVINLKGGVGKTHASWLLAAVCEERKQRVLLVDTDMQANLTSSFVDEGQREPGVEALFDPAQDADPSTLIRKSVFPQIDIIPANTRLARFDLADRHLWEKTELHLSLVEPVSTLRSSYDFILFDCPPRLSVVSFAALCASDYVVIPLEAAGRPCGGCHHQPHPAGEGWNSDLRTPKSVRDQNLLFCLEVQNRPGHCQSKR